MQYNKGNVYIFVPDQGDFEQLMVSMHIYIFEIFSFQLSDMVSALETYTATFNLIFHCFNLLDRATYIGNACLAAHGVVTHPEFFVEIRRSAFES